MNLNLNTTPSRSLETSTALQLHSLGGIALAGLFGGPIASGYLTFRNLQLLGHPNPAKKTLICFVPLVTVWLFIIFKSQPDVISQFIPFLPPILIWWLVARYVLNEAHTTHKSMGGGFKSKFNSTCFGLLTLIALKILELAIYFLINGRVF